MQRSMWSAARESAQDVSEKMSMVEDVDMSEEQPTASGSDAAMKPRRPTIVAQDEKMSVQARLERFQAQIAEKVKAEKMKEAAIQW
jgi:putative aminopeptidase FrvX